jgi:TonB family protein
MGATRGSFLNYAAWVRLRLIPFIFGILCNAQAQTFPARVYGLDYPRLAAQAGVQGTVVVRCELGRDGSVTSVKTVTGPAILADAASANASKWKFPRPKRKAERVELIYRFELCESTTPKSEFIFEPPNLVIVSSNRPYFMPTALGRGRAACFRSSLSTR